MEKSYKRLGELLIKLSVADRNVLHSIAWDYESILQRIYDKGGADAVNLTKFLAELSDINKKIIESLSSFAPQQKKNEAYTAARQLLINDIKILMETIKKE